MKHLLTGPLPHCDSVNTAEEHYRVDAMQMELRLRRVHHTNWQTSIKEIERHFDGLRHDDADVYTTVLYARSRLSAVCSELTDEQLRNAMNGTSNAIQALYSDHDGIGRVVWEYRHDKTKVTEEMLAVTRERVELLLPKMLRIVTEHADTSREATSRRKIGEGIYTGSVDAESPLPAAIAQSFLHLRTLIYLRHPIDLIREIHNWLTDMEHSE